MTPTLEYPGIILPSSHANARNAAYGCVSGFWLMDSARKQGNVEHVVYALPLGALFASLFRYPSPQGRPCQPWRAPSFFRFLSNSYGLRRGIAQDCVWDGAMFDSRWPAASGEGHQKHKSKGYFPCDAVSFSSRSSSLSSPAATRRLNRASLVLARVSAPRRCWTATWRQARSSAQRATCFTVNQTRAAVDLTATKPQLGVFCFFSRWLGCGTRVGRGQWGASTKRGAEYGHYSKSSNLVCNSGGVHSTRRVEPNGLRSVFADTDYRITTAVPGTAARNRRIDHADKSAEPGFGRALRFCRF